MLPLLLLAAAAYGVVNSAPFSGTLTAVYGDNRAVNQIPRHAAFTDSLGKTIIADPSYPSRSRMLNGVNSNYMSHNMDNTNMQAQDGALIRRRRLADDKKMDLKMKMQRVKQVVSLDAIGSYSLYRSPDRKTSLKAFGSTELWYDGKGFGLKKPGLGVQFTIYY